MEDKSLRESPCSTSGVAVLSAGGVCPLHVMTSPRCVRIKLQLKQAPMKRKLPPATDDGKMKKTEIPVQLEEVPENGNLAAAPDIVEIKTPSEPNEEPPQFLGPHSIANLGERLLTALDSSFLTDVTIFVGDEAIKCHFNILSFASPKLAAILTEKEPRLPDMDPRHFRLLLQIIYTGGTTETQDVDTLLQLGREAHDLQVHAAVKFCADILAKKVNAENLWMIMGFANLIRSVNLKESCLETIRYVAGTILETEGFYKCDRATLELILSQEKLCDVTELQLFRACVAWAKENSQSDEVEGRRTTLGSALRLIRFGTFSAEEFATHVCPTGLLSVEHERDIMRSYATGKNCFMPEGFSKLTSSRNPVGRLFDVDLPGFGRHDLGKNPKNTSTSLVFSVNTNVFLLGLKLRAWRTDGLVGCFYEENLLISLQQKVDSGFVVVEEARFRGQLKKGGTFNFKFQRPYEILRNTAYSLNVLYADTDARNVSYQLYERQTLKLNSGLQIRILHEFLAPSDLQLHAANKVTASGTGTSFY